MLVSFRLRYCVACTTTEYMVCGTMDQAVNRHTEPESGFGGDASLIFGHRRLVHIFVHKNFMLVG